MKSSILLLLSVCLSSLPLYSLSQEEKEALPTLSKNELIEIILIYDETLTKIESETDKREQILSERETGLTKREERQSEREASLVMRESLLAESLKIRKEMERTKFWSGFGYGSLTGLVIGSISGAAISNQFR